MISLVNSVLYKCTNQKSLFHQACALVKKLLLIGAFEKKKYVIGLNFWVFWLANISQWGVRNENFCKNFWETTRRVLPRGTILKIVPVAMVLMECGALEFPLFCVSMSAISTQNRCKHECGCCLTQRNSGMPLTVQKMETKNCFVVVYTFVLHFRFETCWYFSNVWPLLNAYSANQMGTLQARVRLLQLLQREQSRRYVVSCVKIET